MNEGGELGRLSNAISNFASRHLDVVDRQFEAPRFQPNSPASSADVAETLYRRARYLMKAGKIEDALPMLADATALSPEHWDAAESYAEALDLLNQTEAAAATYQATRQLRMVIRCSMPDRAFILRRSGRLKTEVTNYTWQLLSKENSPFLYIARGNAELALGNPKRALADYSAALSIQADLPEVLAFQGEAYALLGQYDEALKAFSRALAEAPDSPEALSGRAIVHLARGTLAAADADWRRQLAILPATQVGPRACVALRLAEYALARIDLDRVRAVQPDDPYWQLYRLTVAQRTGEPYVVGAPVAIDVWPGPLIELHAGRLSAAAVLAIAGNSLRQAEAHFQLGVLALALQVDQAREHFQRVVELAPPTQIEHAAARHELMRWTL